MHVQPEREPLDLAEPSRAVVESEKLAPSNLGYFAWVSGQSLSFRFRALKAGDLIKLKALGECASFYDVLLDNEVLATVRFPNRFREVRVLLPRDGTRLQLRRTAQASCPLHFSRVKRQGFVGTTGQGLGELYLISALKPCPPAAPWPQVLIPWALALLVAFGLWWLGETRVLYGLLVSAATAWLLLLYGLAAGVRAVYPPSTLRLVLLVPQGVLLVLFFGKKLAGFFQGRGKSWARTRWFSFLAKPVAATWVFAGALGLYVLWLVATLPQTPMEWDEVLFVRGVLKFDVGEHAPHPPGYPIYMGLSKLFFYLGVDPVHATQLASVVGALLALWGIGWLVGLAGPPTLALFFSCLVAALSPCFSFAANLGLSDILATGLAVLAVATLISLEQKPTRGTAVLAGAMTALACGTRPQVFLALLLPWALVSWRLSRKRVYRWLWAVPAFLLVSLAVWLPVLVLTGWERYLHASRHLASWMNTHEYLSRFPAMEFSRFVADWLVRPLGNETLAASFWLACVAGGWLLWRRGYGRLVALLGAAGGGYLLLAPWTMTAEAAVRYAHPAYALLAPLAAGLVLPTDRLQGARVLLLGTWTLSAFAWVLPALTLRAAEPNPVWAALSWVRETQQPQVVFVNGGIRPHALFVLKPAGFRVEVGDPQNPAPGLWVSSPALARGSQVLFSTSWPKPKIGHMARRRYLSAEVVRCPPEPSFSSAARPKGGGP
ncbi:MAG: ArnT family glycosyltransferase [Thermoanaerobaculum sp.]